MKKIVITGLIASLLAGCTPTQNIDTVYLATHDSFVMSEELVSQFEAESGYQLEIIKLGDTGTLTSKLVVTKQNPVADAVFGIDNTFRSLADQEQIVAGEWSAIDFSDVCFNYDIAWFDKAGITPPISWRNLGDSEYQGLTVVTNPIFSSPGLAFLATTHAGFETDAEVFAYWRSLRDNGVKIAGSWEDAYFVDFTRYGGSYPIVLSYGSSPAAEINEDGSAGTAALLDECFRQTEYAGVLSNAKNAPGAKAVIDFLLSDSFQETVPESMYVYPIRSEIALPDAWAKQAIPARSTLGENLDIANLRDKWLTDWQDVFDN